jgi:hypothetical protein
MAVQWLENKDRCTLDGNRDLLHPKQVIGLHWFHAFWVLSIVYMDSGRLLPLTADGAGIDFIHIFRTVLLARDDS